MAARGFKVVIVDESHTLRTTAVPPDSGYTEATVAALKRASRAILLSGTPSLSRPFDLFRQVCYYLVAILKGGSTVHRKQCLWGVLL